MPTTLWPRLHADMRIKIPFLMHLFTTTGCEPGTQSHGNGLLFSLRVADDMNVSEILDLSSKALIGPYHLLSTFVGENNPFVCRLSCNGGERPIVFGLEVTYR